MPSGLSLKSLPCLPCSSSDLCYWTGIMGRESAHTVSLSQLSFPAGQKNDQSVEQLHWVKVNLILVTVGIFLSDDRAFYLWLDIHAQCHWLSIQLDLHFHPYFSCSLSIDWVTSCACESRWERHEQLLVSIAVKWHVLLNSFFIAPCKFLWGSFPAWDDANLPQLIYNMDILIWAYGISVATGESWSPRLPVDRIFFSNSFLYSPYSYYTPLKTYWWRNCLLFFIIFISITFPKLLDCMKWWKHGWHLGLMQNWNLYGMYFYEALINLLLQTPYATCMWGLMFIL